MILPLEGVSVLGVCACLPPRSEDNLARCAEVYGDEKRH